MILKGKYGTSQTLEWIFKTSKIKEEFGPLSDFPWFVKLL